MNSTELFDNSELSLTAYGKFEVNISYKDALIRAGMADEQADNFVSEYTKLSYQPDIPLSLYPFIPLSISNIGVK